MNQSDNEEYKLEILIRNGLHSTIKKYWLILICLAEPIGRNDTPKYLATIHYVLLRHEDRNCTQKTQRFGMWAEAE